MEEIYSEQQQICKITKARPETVKFLLGFSKSFQVTEYQDIKFDNYLN